MHTLVELVSLSVKKYYMALTEIQLKHVYFMAPLAKKDPDPCPIQWHVTDTSKKEIYLQCFYTNFAHNSV